MITAAQSSDLIMDDNASAAHKCVCEIMIVSIEDRAIPDSSKISCGLVGAVPGQVLKSCLVVLLYSKPYIVKPLQRYSSNSVI